MKRVDFNDICRYLGVRVFSYKTGADQIQRLHLEQIAKKNPWVCCLYRGTPIIFFDATRSARAIRFSVATALAYFGLGYLNGQETKRLTRWKRLKANLLAVRIFWRLARANWRFQQQDLEYRRDQNTALELAAEQRAGAAH